MMFQDVAIHIHTTCVFFTHFFTRFSSSVSVISICMSRQTARTSSALILPLLPNNDTHSVTDSNRCVWCVGSQGLVVLKECLSEVNVQWVSGIKVPKNTHTHIIHRERVETEKEHTLQHTYLRKFLCCRTPCKAEVGSSPSTA